MIERERREYDVNALHQNICFTYGLHDILMSTFEMQRVVAASGDEFFEVGRRPNGSSPTRVVRRLRTRGGSDESDAHAPPHCHLDRATSRTLAELLRRRLRPSGDATTRSILRSFDPYATPATTYLSLP
jgi:hypothetical protein